MDVPPEIVFRDGTRSEELETLIYDELADLETIYDNINSAHVAVAKPVESGKQGSPYRVRLDIRVPPGREVIATREPGQGDMHLPLDRVIKDAFEAARRQLKELKERQRGEVKNHPSSDAGALVEKLFPEEGYGFVKTVEGREAYFHKNAVLHGDFERLEVGTGVRVVLEDGDKGLQASTVAIVDKPGARRGVAEDADLP